MNKLTPAQLKMVQEANWNMFPEIRHNCVPIHGSAAHQVANRLHKMREGTVFSKQPHKNSFFTTEIIPHLHH